MEIKSSGRVESGSVRKYARASSSSDSTFKISDVPEQPRAATVAAPGPITALDSIIVLQSVDDASSGASKGLAHGEQLLDLLDNVRDGLLSGGIPRITLNRLATAVSRRHENFADPKLQGVLDEIELRAKVELAKLEQADRAVA
ncbi:MAG: flagellar assembly protein FliX [Rhizomicrobium sp.]